METRRTVPMKALSLFLSVLMAFSCFSIALPNLAPEAKAADAGATDKQWDALVSAFEVAYNAGEFTSAGWTVQNYGKGNITVEDSTLTGYYYNVVRALADVAAATKGEDYDHNATLREYIKGKLCTKLGSGYTTYMDEYIDAILVVPDPKGEGTAFENGVYGWYGDDCWEGLTENVTNFPEVTYTVTATRSAKAAVLTDYDNAADVPETVETEYKLTIVAKPNTGVSENYGDGYSTLWYENDSLTCTAGMAATPDLSAITAYNDYVSSGLFAEIWAEYKEDNDSIYQRTSKELRSFRDTYQPLLTAANTCDGDIVAKFIGNTNMAGYTTFVNTCYAAADVTDLKPYVDWIKGLPINDEQYDDVDYSIKIDGEDFYRNSRDYTGYTEDIKNYNATLITEDDVKVMYNLITLAQTFAAKIGTDASVIATLTEKYGYDKDAYTTYINDLRTRIGEKTVAEIKEVYKYVTENSAPSYYTFAETSAYYTGESYDLSKDTEVDEDKTYYVIESYNYNEVDAPVATGLSAYYERSEAEPYTYTLTTDTAVDAEKVYYTQGKANYTKVKEPTGNPTTSNYYEYTPAARLMAVGNETYYSQSYAETGKECPMSDAELSNTYSYLTTFQSTLSATDKDVVGVYFTDTDLTEFDNLISALATEIEYRGFADVSKTYSDLYEYFLNAKLNKKASNLSDETLWGKAAVADDESTPDVDETEPAVEGFISEAETKYAALIAAYNEIVNNGTYDAGILSRYAAFNASAREYVNGLYAVLYNRCRDDLVTIRDYTYDKETNTYGNIDAENFSAVKGAISNFDEAEYGESQLTGGDADKYPVAENARYEWVTNNTNWAKISAACGIGDTEKKELTDIYGDLLTYSNACKTVSAEKWNNVSATRKDNATWRIREEETEVITDTYTTRDALENDMARYLAKDGADFQRYEYKVTDAKIETVITKLDDFLKSDSFIKLIGLYDEEDGVTSLTGFIQDLLIENIFTDKIVNTVIALLLPMVCNLIDTLLPELLADLVINDVHCSTTPTDTANYNAALNLPAVIKGAFGSTTIETDVADIIVNSGTVNINYNGYAGKTNTLAYELSLLGLNIYPMYFATKLPDSINGVSLTAFKSALTSAGYTDSKNNGGWQYFDTYNEHYFQYADGTWYENSAKQREGYNDGEITADDFANVCWGVTDYDTFCNALAAVFTCIEPLVKTIFCNQQYYGKTSDSDDGKRFIDASLVNGSVTADLTIDIDGTLEFSANGYAEITIDGIEGYNNVWAPIFEAMGITGRTASDTVDYQNAPFSSTLGTSSTASVTQIVNGLIAPLYNLIITLSENPLSTLTGMLPNLAYCLAYDMVQPLINQLKTNINIKAQLKITKITTFKIGILGLATVASWFLSTINSKLKDQISFDVGLDLGSMLDLNDMLGADISDLNSLLVKFIPDIASSLPAINTARLGLFGTRTTSASVRTAVNENGGPGAGECYYIEADKADVLYDILKFVLDFASDSGALSNLLTALGVELPDAVLTLVENIAPEDAIAALTEIFLPRGVGDGTTGYDMAVYSWYVENTSASHYTFKPGSESSFVYLTYSNDWTREKAEYVYDNLDTVVNDLLKSFGGDTFENFEGINEWLLSTVYSLFSNQGITNILDLAISLSTASESESHSIANLIKEQITVNGVDLNLDYRVWYNTYGYLYGDKRVLGTHEEEVDGKTVEYKEIVYKPLDSNGAAADFCVGYDKNEFKKSGEEGYGVKDIEFLRTYPLAPLGFAGFTEEDENYVPAAENGKGQYGEVTSYLQAVEDKKTGETTYTTVNTTPDASYVNSFSLLSVEVSAEPDANGCYFTWSITGNANTTELGLVNGTKYTLVDGGQKDVAGSSEARNRFTAIFCALMEPIMPVFALLFTANDLELFNGAIVLKGYDCYDGAIIPALEALGVTGLPTQDEYKKNYSITEKNGTTKATEGFYVLCQKLFDWLGDVLSYDKDENGNITKTPIQKVIELLPPIFYFLKSDGLSTLIKNLLMPVWVLVDTIRPIADADLDDFIHQFLCNMLGLSYKKEGKYASTPAVDAILELTGLLDYVPYTASQAKKDANYVDAIYQISIEKLGLDEIKTLVAAFTKQDDGKYFDIDPLIYAFEGMCNTYTYKGVTYGVHEIENSAYTASGINTGIYNYSQYKVARTLKYYGPDIITVTLSVLLDLLRYKDNAKVLDNLIGLVGDYVPNLKLDDVSASGLLEAVSFVFEERGDTNSYRTPNWDYLLEGKTVTRPSDGKVVTYTADEGYKLLQEFSDVTPYHTLYTLAYKTDWTYDTAESVDKMLSTVLDYVTVAFLAGEDEGITSFSEYINGLLGDLVFNGDILKTIAGLMATIYNTVPASAVAMIDELIDINMTAWLNAGYIATGADRISESSVLENTVMEYDFDEDGKIADSEKFFKYKVTVNDTELAYDIATGKCEYTFSVDDKISKQEYCFDKDGNYVEKKSEDNEDVISYYVAIGTYTDGYVEAEGTDTENEVNYFYSADKDYKCDATGYTVNYDFGWWNEAKDQTNHPYVDTKEEFMDALEEILLPCSKLFASIFLSKGYKYFYTEGNNIQGYTDSDDTDALILDGVGAYKEAIIPLLEAFGVPLTEEQYDAYEKMGRDMSHYERKDYSDAKYQKLVTDSSWTVASETWVSDMVDVFSGFVFTVIDDPVNWLLDNFANVIYFINAGGLTAIIANLFDDVQKVLDAVNTMLDSDSQILSTNIAGLDLTNITLEGIFNLLSDNDKTGNFHISSEHMAYLRSLFVGSISSYTSANGNPAFRMDCNEEEDRADLITVLLSIAIEIVEDSGYFVDAKNNYNYTYYSNLAAIDRLIDSDLEDGETGLVEGIVDALKNPQNVKYGELDWNYFDEEYNLAEAETSEDGAVIVPGFAFQYLSYSTQWTYSKALATSEGLEELVNSILGMTGLIKDGETISDLLDLSGLFTGRTLQELLDTVSGLLYGEESILNEELINVIGCVLGADLTQWNGNYAFTDEVSGKTSVDTETGLSYVMTANYVKTSDTEVKAEKKYYTYDAGEYKEVETPSAENIGAYYEYAKSVKTYLVNDSQSFAKGLTLLLKPAYRLLAWLLFDEGYSFFQSSLHAYNNDPLITLQGAEGYKYSLSFLLEALGCNGLGFATKYENIKDNAIADGAERVDAINEMMGVFMTDLTDSLMNRIDEICADPINQIVALIPELIYFINAGGLGVVVNNLVAGILSLVENTPALAGLILDDVYVLTSDTAITEGKTYYTKNEDNSYTEVTSPAADKLATYYEADKVKAGEVVDSLLSGVIDNALKDMLDTDKDGSVSEAESLGFTLEGIDIKWVFNVVEKITGLKVNDLLQNSLDKFYMGDIKPYVSKSGIIPAYKMVFGESYSKGGNGDFADFVTILLTFVIDIALYQWEEDGTTKSNAQAILKLINGEKTADDEGYIDPGLIDSIIAFIKEGYTVDIMDIEWLYFDDSEKPAIIEKEDGSYAYNGGDTIAYDSKVTVPERTINYLTYASDWTESTAKYIVTNRNQLVDSILSLLGVEGTVADAIAGIFNPTTDLYTADILNSLFDLVKGLTDSLPSVVFDLLGIILDVDFSYYDSKNGFFTEDTYTLVEIDKFDDDTNYYVANEAAEGGYSPAPGEYDKDTKYYVFNKKNFKNGDRAQFVSELTGMLTPLNIILDWLLFGKSITYFDKKYYELDEEGNPILDTQAAYEVLISLQGADGYKYGLVPLLEALGVSCPAVGNNDTTEDILSRLVNNVLARVEAILANPVDEILALIPELIYFINANGLAASVNNLLSGVVALVNKVAETGALEGIELFDGVELTDVNSVVNALLKNLGIELDITKLDLCAILKVVEDFTKVEYGGYVSAAEKEFSEDETYYTKKTVPAEKEGEEDTVIYETVEKPVAGDIADYYVWQVNGKTDGIKIFDVVNEATSHKIDKFYLGQLTYYKSASGLPAFKMEYSEEEGMEDILTIIANFAIELVLYGENGKAIDALINGVDENGEPKKSTVNGIVSIIEGLKDIEDAKAEEINWNYFDEEVTLTSDGVTVPGNAFVYLAYSNDWTYDAAAYLDTNIVNIINEVLALTAGEGEEPQTIDDLVAGLVDLDELLNADLLNQLLDLVAPLLYGEDSFLSEYLLSLIGLVLGADLTTWNYTYRFEAYDSTKEYGTDPDTGLKYRVGSFTVDSKEYTDKKIFAIEDAEDFSTGLAYVLKPAERLLGWLLLGQNYGFFVSNTDGNVNEAGERQDGELLKIPGFNGYDTSLTLLLEALGCELEPASEFVGNESALLKSVIDSLLKRVDEILDNPIDEILGLIPELLYFINAGGLNAVVMNLAGGILNVVDYVNNSGLLDSKIELDLDDIVSGLINSAYAKTLGKDVEDLTEEEEYDFSLKTVNLQTVIDIAEMFTGLEISDAIGYSLAKFAIGEVYAYDTASATYKDNAYKMRFAATGDSTDNAHDRADMITIVLSVVLDVLREDGNAEALAELIGSDMITENVIKTVVDVLNGWTVPEMMDVEWFYPISEPTVDDVATIDGTTTITMVERTINYLTYASDWNEETAEYLIDNLDALIAAVLELMGQEKTSVAEIIEGVFDIKDFYSAEILNDLVGTISGLTKTLGTTLTNVVGLILSDNTSIATAYDGMTFSDADITDRTSFANGLAQIVNPIAGVLDWLLFGDDYRFFYDNDFYTEGNPNAADLLVLTGNEGYAYSLVPLLEALGVKGLPEVTEATKTNDVLAQVIDAVLNRVEEILADPVDEVLGLIPNLLYFINANGITVVVNNLLASVIGLLDEAMPAVVEIAGKEIKVSEDFTIVLAREGREGLEIKSTSAILNDIINSLLSETLNGYDEIDYRSLKLLDIVEILEAITGLRIAEVVTEDKITNFYLGKVTYFRSTNGKAAFTMNYTTDEEKHDLITIILNFLVEVALYEDGEFSNADALVDLLDLDESTGDIVDLIIDLLTGNGDPYDYAEDNFKWNYANTDLELGDGEEGPDVVVPSTKFIYLAYQNNWTYNKAQYLDTNLVSLVDTVIGMIDSDAATLSDFIAGKVDLDELLFKADTLNSLYTTVSELLYGEEAVISNVLSEAAGLLLGADLTTFNDRYVFEARDASKTYRRDTLNGLDYRVDNGTAYFVIEDSTSFINGLVMILKPADRLLSWLFLGESYGFFVSNTDGNIDDEGKRKNEELITIPGCEGYAKGLALLLEALGLEGLKDDYANATEMLRAILTSLVARVEDILANPIDEVLALIPELIYFINANGLGVVVNNLAATAFNILDPVIEAGLISGVTDRTEWVNGLVEDLLQKALDSEELTFDLNGINIQWIIDTAEIILKAKLGDIRINEVLADSILGENYPLSIFQIGTAKQYGSVSGFKTAYKCEFDSEGTDRADMITILLSFVIDMLRNDTNRATIEKLAGLTSGTIEDIFEVITKFAVEIEPDIDWFYFDEDFTYTEESALELVPTINYLTYASDWTDDLATYLDKNLDEIVAEVLNMVGVEGTVADIVKGLFDPAKDLYTAANLNSIVELVTGLLTKLDGALATLVPDAVELLLNVNLHAWDDMKFEDGAICDKETFIDGLYEVLEPIFPLLDWILFDEDYAFFNRSTAADNIEDLIVINGYAGYAYGLVPLLEALGVAVPELPAPDSEDYCTAGQLKGLLQATFTRIENILADPVEEALALIPNLLYFINANGLASAINNLLGVVLQLVDKVNPILKDLKVEISLDEETTITEIDVNYLVNHFVGDLLKGYEIDVKKLDLIEIIRVAEAYTGLDLEGFVRENGIEEFYVGQIKYFESANGEPAFKMVYSEDKNKDRHDLITVIVNYLIEAVTYGDNAKKIDILIGGDENNDGEADKKTVEPIIEMLKLLGAETVPGDFHWAYFNEETDEGNWNGNANAGEGAYEISTNMNLPKTAFNNHLKYSTTWTQNTADTLYDNLDDVVTAVLTLTGSENNTVAKLIKSFFDPNEKLYTADLLNQILALTEKLYDLLDEKLVDVLGMVLGCDLSAWNRAEFTDDEIYDHDTFLNGLCELLEPISGLLDWLLFGDGFNFFVEDATDENQKTLINIAGADGYLYGLAPIFIALGVDLPEYKEGYKTKTDVGGQTFIRAILGSVLDRMEEILDDPVDEALDLITGLLYFINANGLSTAVYNLAGGVLNAVNVLVENGVIDLGGTTIEAYVEDSLGLNLKNLDLEGVFAFVEEKVDLKGIKIYELFNGTYDPGTETFTYDENGEDNILEKFYVGKVKSYTYGTSDEGKALISGWTMVNADHNENGGRGDIITMLLSIVLDVIFYEENEEALAELIDGLLGEDVTFTTENFVALKALLMSGADFEQTFGANWLYWTGKTAEEQQADIIAVLSADTTAIPELPSRTVNYLELDNNWNQETSDYLDENINDIVDLVINMISSGESETLEAFIENNLDIYTTEIAQLILDKIAGLISKLDATLTEELKDKLLVTAGSLLGVDINAVIAPVTEINDEAPRAEREAKFVEVLAKRLGNLSTVLDWLLFGEDLTFFTKLEDGKTMITISGGEGYKYGLAPLLEAIGVNTRISEDLTCANGALEALLTNVAARIDELLYGGNNCKTLDEVLALLPELIYFINTGAVSECIMNLLQPADELLTVVNANLGNGSVLKKNSVADFFSFKFNEVEYKLSNIDFDFLFDLLIDKTGIDLRNATGLPADPSVELDTVGNYLKNFYFGELQSYTSYGDIQAIRMVYTDSDDRIDMITLLVTLVLDVAFSGNNKQAIIDIIDNVLGEDADMDAETIYSTVVALLTDRNVEISYQKFDWMFTEEPYNFADTGKLVCAGSVDGSLFTDTYGPLYTRAMGEYMTKYLDVLINTYLTLLGVKVNGKYVKNLDELLEELIGASIYKTEYLQMILDLLVDLIDNLKETLGEDLFDHLAYLIDNILGVNLNYWDGYTVAEIPENDSEKFVDELCRMLRPAYPILKWLLTSEDIAIFNKTGTSETVGSDANDYILLQGAEGYRYGIVPILEALNSGASDDIPTQSEYEALIAEDEDNILRVILNRLVVLIDNVFAEPITTVVNLVPSVAYFMNSNGLDTTVKNLLAAVYNLLTAIDPLIKDVDALHQEDGTVDLLALAGIDLREITLNSIMDDVAGENGLKIKIGDSELDLSSAVVDLARELAVGYVVSYDSAINEEGSFFQQMYTMTTKEDETGASGAVGDSADIVTVLLRLVLKFVSDNPEFIKDLLKDSLSGDGYTLLCSLVDNFAQMSGTQDGMDKIMYTFYYIYYSALVAGVATNNGLAEFNGNYSFLYNMFATSDVATVRQLSETWKSWLHVGENTDEETGETEDGPFSPIIDEDGIIPDGQISFWQKIVEFFKKIINFFKNLF